MLGLSPKTVLKFMRAATAGQVTAGPWPLSSGIDRFAPYLHQRWNQGCSDAAPLHAEIQAQGYRGSQRSARRYLQPLRATLAAPVLPLPPPTVREVTRWITSHPDHLTDEETAKLGQVKARSTRLSATAGHVTAFAGMMTGRHGEHRQEWIAAVDLDSRSSGFWQAASSWRSSARAWRPMASSTRGGWRILLLAEGLA